MSELDQLEQQLKNARELVKRRDNALQLGQNSLFREMILEEFIVNESARLVAQSADPILSDKEQKDALSMAQAGGHLKRWLSIMCRMGDTAEAEIPQIEAAIDEVRTGGSED